MKLSEFIKLVKGAVNDPMLDSGCPICYLSDISSNPDKDYTHIHDWKSFYHVFKDTPEYLIANLEYLKLTNTPPEVPSEVE